MPNGERFIVIGGYISFLLSLYYILITPPANGYEPSIYWSLPIYFWISLILSLLIAISLISLSLKKGFLDDKEKDKLWIYGVILIFLIYSIILFLPTVRGYPFGDIDAMNDTFAHLAYVEYVLNNFHLYPSGDPYVTSHLFIVFVTIFGITISQTINFIPSTLLLLLLLFSFVFGRSLSLDRKFQIVIFLTSIPILFSQFTRIIQPSLQITYFYILYLYIYNKTIENLTSIKLRLLSLLIFSFICFYHPLSSLILIIFIAIMACTKYIFFKIKNAPININSDLNYLGTIIVIYIGSLSYLMLQLNSLKEFYERFVGIKNDYEGTTSAVLSTAQENTDILEIFNGFIRIYGHQALYLTLGLLCAVIIYVSIIKGKTKILLHEIIYTNLFISGLIIASFLLSGILIMETFRTINYALIIAPLLIAIVFYNIINRNLSTNTKKGLIICLLLMVCFASFIGVFRIYNDAWFGNKNTQFTYEDYYGMSWILKENQVNKYESSYKPIPIIMNSYPSYVFRIFYFKDPHYPFQYKYSEQKLNPSFLYNNNSVIGKISLYECQYMITYDKMKLATVNVPENKLDKVKNNIFTESDFYRLSLDPSVNKIYTNSGFEEWMILKMS